MTMSPGKASFYCSWIYFKPTIGQRTPVSSGRNCQPRHPLDDCNTACQHEAQGYRHAFLALVERICRSDEAELQELLESIRKPDSLAEAVQEILDRRHCWSGISECHRNLVVPINSTHILSIISFGNDLSEYSHSWNWFTHCTLSNSFWHHRQGIRAHKLLSNPH